MRVFVLLSLCVLFNLGCGSNNKVTQPTDTIKATGLSVSGIGEAPGGGSRKIQ